MKTYKKIDIFIKGKYFCSTNQSRTCKEARGKFLSNLKYKAIEKHIKVRFSK